MQDSFEYPGYWWTTNNKDNRIYGTLKYSESSGISLSLIGSFADKLEDIFGDTYDNLKIIHGFITDGKNVTLLDSFRTKNSLGGLPTSIYSSDMVVIGKHYNSKEDIITNELDVNYKYLNEWIGIPIFKGDNQLQSTKQFILTYSIPENHPVKINNTNLSLKFKINTNSKKSTSISLKQIATINFSNEDGIQLDECMNLIHSFGNFLTLCTGKNAPPTSITLKENDCDNIKIIYNLIDNISELEMNNYHYFLFKYVDIKDNFEKYIKTWFLKKEILSPIIYYFIDAHREEVFSEMSFLKLVQALEAFSRRIRNNFKVEQNEHNKIVNRILENILEPIDKEWLQSILRYSNEPTLKTRLKDLFNETNFILEINSSKRKKYIYKVLETRNYYTHFDKSKENIILNIEEMLASKEIFVIMLRIVLLKELGFPNQFIKDNIDKKNIINWAKEKLNLV